MIVNLFFFNLFVFWFEDLSLFLENIILVLDLEVEIDALYIFFDTYLFRLIVFIVVFFFLLI